ncbi:MAG: helix-turn-helix domain-containing protein [Acutalibacter sp.]
MESIHSILVVVTISQKLKQDLSIGPNLKSLRKAVKLTQEQVAAQLQLRGLDVSREMYCQMEQGRYSVRISVLKALKDIYKAPSYDEFFKGL